MSAASLRVINVNENGHTVNEQLSKEGALDLKSTQLRTL